MAYDTCTWFSSVRISFFFLGWACTVADLFYSVTCTKMFPLNTNTFKDLIPTTANHSWLGVSHVFSYTLTHSSCYCMWCILFYRCPDCGSQLSLWPHDLCGDREADEGGSGEGWSEGSLHGSAAGIPHSWLQLPGIYRPARVPLR